MQWNVRSSLLFGGALALGGATAGCGLLDDDLGRIRIPVTYTIPQSIPIAFPNSGRLSELQSGGSTTVPILSYFPVSLGDLQGAPRSIDLVKGVEIDAVTMEVEENSLSDVALQPFELRVGAPGTQVLAAEVGGADFASAMVSAIIPEQAPGFVGTVPGQIQEENRDAIADRIASLDFGFGIGTSLRLDGAIPEGGRADVKFTIRFVFVVDAIPL